MTHKFDTMCMIYTSQDFQFTPKALSLFGCGREAAKMPLEDFSGIGLPINQAPNFVHFSDMSSCYTPFGCERRGVLGMEMPVGAPATWAEV